MGDALSLSDIAAVTKDADGFSGGSSWWIIVFLIFAMMGGTWGGNGAANAATTADIQRAVDLNGIQSSIAGVGNDIQRGIYEINGATKDAAYNNLSEIRDVGAAIATGNANIINNLTAMAANQQNCCCTTQRAIDSVNYNLAEQSAAIQANDTANTQKVLDAISQNRMADMQSQINNLQLQLATASTVKYPTATTFSMSNPYCGCSNYNL